MNVAITGSSGLVGAALCQHLKLSPEVSSLRRLVRRAARNPTEVSWDPDAERVDSQALEGVGAVIHLAGQGVAEQRWTRDFKARIRDSRIKGTRAVAKALLSLKQPPKVLISASGIGCYGDRGDEWLDESSALGTTFLADVCRDWEAEARAVEPTIRVVHLRIGMVLSSEGGALAKMLTPFKLGAGGRLGSGRQYISWLSLHDLVRAITFALSAELHGPVNAVAPNPVTNAVFTQLLARSLHRPHVVAVPGFALRAAVGELAEELLGGQRARPRALLDAGFHFEHATLESAFAAVLGRAARS